MEHRRRLRALESGLAVVGCAVSEVQGVMVTHIHPDHYGLAGRIREASGAWISLHPADARLIHDRYTAQGPAGAGGRGAAPDGRSGRGAGTLQQAAMPVRRLVDAVLPDVLLEDGARPEVPGWELTAIWTPGHSPGHLCFHEARYDLMLSGDHVLPRITPNISYNPQAGRQPAGRLPGLARQARALRGRGGAAGPRVPLLRPAARLAELRRHHRDRFAEVVHILGDGSASALGHRRAHDLVPPVGGDRRLHAPGRRGRGHVAPVQALRVDGVVEVARVSPTLWSLSEARPTP